MSAALPVAVLPARVATRVTFAMAAPLCVVWTLVPGSAPVTALLAYWLIAAALGVGAFGPVGERVSAAIVTGSWLLTGAVAVVTHGPGGGATLLAGTLLAGLFFGPGAAYVASAAGGVWLAAVGAAQVSGRVAVGGPPIGSGAWALQALTFVPVSGMSAYVQASVLGAARAARDRARQVALVVERTDSSVVITGVDEVITWVNPAFTELTGYSAQEAIGRRPGELLQGPASDPRVRAVLRDRLRQGLEVAVELVNYNRAREPYWIRLEIRPFHNEAGGLLGFTGLQVDVTAQRLRVELAAVERALSEGLAGARSPEEAYGALVTALRGASAVVVALAGPATADGLDVVSQVATEADRFGADALAAVAARCREGVAAVVEADRLTAAGLAIERVVATVPAVGTPGRVVVALALDIPGAEAMRERLPELLLLVGQTFRRIEQQRRFEALFEQSPDALVLVDAAGRVRQRNAVAVDLLPAAALGADAAAAIPDLAQALARAPEPAGPARAIGWAIDTGAGAAREVEATLAPIPLAEGTGWLASVRDVTARRAAERALADALAEVQRSLSEREVLLKEIHHRVKNNLQIVSSLLDMQGQESDQPTVRQALVESKHRVRSMALIHQMLYSGESLAQVNIGAYAAQLARELAGAVGQRVALELVVEEVFVAVERAIPCGLILNELVTNALKHGRSADGVCHLRLTAGRDGDRIALVVADQGPGLPPRDERRFGSLGMQIVASLTAQLGGRFVEGPGPGAVLTVSFAASPDDGSATIA
jgi:PAS domain S-box-containing protein